MRIRECKICGKDFEAKRPVWRCKPCINNAANEKRRASIEELKAKGVYKGHNGRTPDLEGTTYEERYDEWRLRRKYLDGLEDRTEWQAFFMDEFKRIESNTELWKSLTRPTLGEDIRGAKSVKGKQRGVIGRPTHSSTNYPDTRNVNIDDTFGYRMDED